MADGSLASLTATLGSTRQVTRLRLCFENVTFEREAYDESSARPGTEPWTILPKTPEIGAAIDASLREIAPQHEWFVRQYELFADALAAGTPFPVTLADARLSIELVTAMFESDDARLGGAAAHPGRPPALRGLGAAVALLEGAKRNTCCSTR